MVRGRLHRPPRNGKGEPALAAQCSAGSSHRHVTRRWVRMDTSTTTFSVISGRPLSSLLRRGMVAGTNQGGRVPTYYVDFQNGNDEYAGVAPASAWQTVERVNRGRYGVGDRIVFAANQTFPGTIQLGEGLPEGLTVSSFGEGRATIDGGAS